MVSQSSDALRQSGTNSFLEKISSEIREGEPAHAAKSCSPATSVPKT